MSIPQPSAWVQRAFGLTLFFSALTGFAQMPIFKRYYIADVPGLGWLAEYYVTYRLHYISATLFIAIGVYLALHHLLLDGNAIRLPVLSYVKATLLGLIVVTGMALVYRNLPGYRFSPMTVVVLNFSHLGLVMIFLLTALVGRALPSRDVTSLS